MTLELLSPGQPNYKPQNGVFAQRNESLKDDPHSALLDTGSVDHFVTYKEWSNQTDIRPKQNTFQCANQTKLTSNYIANLKLKTVAGLSLFLKDVNIVPSEAMSFTIISFNKLIEDNNLTVKLNKHENYMEQGGIVQELRTDEQGLMFLPIVTNIPKEVVDVNNQVVNAILQVHETADETFDERSINNNTIEGTTIVREMTCMECDSKQTAVHTDEQLAHCRTGHSDKRKQSIVKDMTLNGNKLFAPVKIVCEACTLGRMIKLSRPYTGTVDVQSYAIIYLDVIGPVRGLGPKGEQYISVIHVGWSKWTEIALLSEKSSVASHAKGFCIRYNNRFSSMPGYGPIQESRSDGGSEYKGAYTVYCQETGILQQLSAPYTSQQNGAAERMNRTILERARTLILSGKIARKHWPHAFQTAVYLLNRTKPVQVSKNVYKTPYELHYGSKPDAGRFRIYGCTAYAYNRDVKAHKLDQRGIRCKFIGYTETMKAYILYNPITSKLLYTDDVIFNENELVQEAGATYQQIHEALPSYDDVALPHTMSEYGENRSNDAIMATPTQNEELQQDDRSDETGIGMDEIVNHDQYEDAEDDGAPEVLAYYSDMKDLRNGRSYGKFVNHIKRMVSAVLPFKPNGSDMPTSPLDSKLSSEAKFWRIAEQVELDNLFTRGVMKRVLKKLVLGKVHVIPTRWHYVKKIGKDNTVSAYKVRIIVQGHRQQVGIDCDENNYSPVINHFTIIVLLHLAAKQGHVIHSIDIKAAFLYADLKEKVYVKIPPGILDSEDYVWELDKALYGLKQSPQAWNDHLTKFIEEKLGFKSLPGSPCLFRQKNGPNAVSYIGVYVDDMIITSYSLEKVEQIKQAFKDEFELKDNGEITYLLGVNMIHDKVNRTISLNQTNYIERLIETFNAQERRSRKYPINGLLVSNPPVINSEVKSDLPYRELLGSLLYISNFTRPDIAFAVSFLSKFSNCYTDELYNHALDVLLYLHGSKDACLKLGGSGPDELSMYADASGTQSLQESKCTQGHGLYLNNRLILWKSSRQQLTSLSTAEAEYSACTYAMQSFEYAHFILSGLEAISNRTKISFFCDNQAAVAIAAGIDNPARTKHMLRRIFYLRESLKHYKLKLEYISTKEMRADIYTKALAYELFNNAIKQLGLDKHYANKASSIEQLE